MNLLKVFSLSSNQSSAVEAERAAKLCSRYPSFDTFTDVLHLGGLDALLKILNSRVHHRYTAVYRFDGQQMKSLSLLDAESPIAALDMISVDHGHSFCQFAMRDGKNSAPRIPLQTRVWTAMSCKE